MAGDVKTKEIFDRLMQSEEIGSNTASSIKNSLKLMDSLNKERSEQLVKDLGVAPSFNRNRMKIQDVNNHFTNDMNNLLNFLRTGFGKEDAYKRLSELNDGWKKYPILANSLFKYAMDDRIVAAARAGAKYDGGYNESTGDLVFNYPKTVEERLERI